VNGQGIPIIRLTLEGMRAEVLHALLSYEAELAEETRKAVEAFCTPENIQRVMQQHVHAVLSQAVRDEVEAYYRRGDGRAAVQLAVQEALHRWGPPPGSPT
jgi:hypothetical protein